MATVKEVIALAAKADVQVEMMFLGKSVLLMMPKNYWKIRSS